MRRHEPGLAALASLCSDLLNNSAVGSGNLKDIDLFLIRKSLYYPFGMLT